jgi:hypothetical protein
LETAPAPWKQHAHVALGLVGLGAALAMLRHTDLGALRTFGPWAAFAVAVEGVRVLAESLATRSLHGPEVRVPWWTLLRAHLVGYALAMTMPAGRTVAEASKAVLLAPWTGTARSVGVAATNQALVMLSTGLVSLPCAIAAWAYGHRALAATVAVQGVTLVGLGGGMLAMVRSRTIAAWAGRRIPRLAAMAAGASESARVPGVGRALGCFVVHRSVQALQLGVLLRTLGLGGVVRALALTGASIVGTSVGVAVPGQLGAIGGAMALAAPGLGVAAAQALAMALVIHAAQFTWVALGFAVWTFTRAAPGNSARPSLGLE